MPSLCGILVYSEWTSVATNSDYFQGSYLDYLFFDEVSWA